jgi:hypothetical protein
MQAILVALASASAFVAHAPRCATSQAPRSAPAKAVLSVNPDDDEPLDFRKEIDELKVVTEGLARKTGALSSKVDLIDKETKMLMIDRLDANQNFLASAVAKNFTMLDQYFRYETKAETETEQDPLAISAKDDTLWGPLLNRVFSSQRFLSL